MSAGPVVFVTTGLSSATTLSLRIRHTRGVAVSLLRVLEGFAILSHYEDVNGIVRVTPTHDRLLVGCTPPDVMNKYDREALDELGWRWDNQTPAWYFNV